MIEHLLDRQRDDARLVVGAHHRVRLARASLQASVTLDRKSTHLAVGEDGAVEALDRRADHRSDRGAVELERRLVRRDEGVEAEVVGIVG